MFNALLVAGLMSALQPPVPSQAEFLGAVQLPGGMRDMSGLSTPLAPGLPHDLVGAFGSGMTYVGQGDEYLVAPDRGPQDGAFPFRPRLHRMRITVTPGSGDSPRWRLQAEVLATMLLRRRDGTPFSGATTAIDGSDQAASSRLDPEAVAFSPRGTVYTADEYGPWVDEWTKEGVHVRRLQAPEKFRVVRPAATGELELAMNSTGRQPNRGLEGMALSADGRRLYGLMQGPLIQDGALDAKKKRIGRNVRMFEYGLSEAGEIESWREFVYVLDDPAHGLNELLWLGDGAFLAIEKDGKAGAKAAARRIYRIDLREATDVTRVGSLPSGQLPPEIKPVMKTLVLDMLDARFALAGESMPEKVEGLALGPDLPDGRRLLLIASDNDYRLDAPSWIWAFAMPRALLDAK